MKCELAHDVGRNLLCLTGSTKTICILCNVKITDNLSAYMAMLAFVVDHDNSWNGLYMLQAIATCALSQALSSGLPSPAHALSISAAPAAVIHMDLAAASASLTQPAASSASTGSLLPAIAAQQTHLGCNADNHPMPSPNYRMDHVLADSLHAGLHASHDFGPMSLASAMSNDENMTPAASRDFGRTAGGVTQEGPTVAEEAPQVIPNIISLAMSAE